MLIFKNFLDKIENNANINKKNKDKLKTEFYWEYLNQKCPYNPKLKYCIYFKGCCCPPHKGHLNSIKSAVKQFPGCKIIINHVCSASRHRVPIYFSSELFKKYLSIIFKKNELKYMLNVSSTEIFKNNFVTNSDCLIIIRGDEYTTSSRFFNEKTINLKNEENKKRDKKYISFLNQKNIKVNYIFEKRNTNLISATEFIKHLNIYKNKLSNNVESKKYLDKVKSFIPDELNSNEKYKIIKKLIEFDTY